jgi:putative ABC transport system permease protein
LSSIWRDLRYALRSLTRAPTFTVVAVLTLALGIGANTAIFSVVDGVLLRALPYDRPEELVTVWLDKSRRDGPVREWFTSQDLADYRAEPGLFEEIGGWGGYGPTLTGLGEPEVLTAATVTEGTFEGVFHARPFLGRGFLPEEDQPGAAGSVILSYSFWQERFGGDRSALGRSVVLDEQPHVVVGIMPEGFEPPFVPKAELWVPAQLDPAQCGRGCYSVRAVARLAPGVSLGVGRTRASALAARLADAYPNTNAKVGVAIFGLQEDMVRPAARALWILLGAVGFVLLIACTNVANLMLARGAARRAEFSVRVALGAGRAPIFRQLLTESATLAVLGGALGLVFAAWGTDLLLATAPVALPGFDQVGLDGRILAFTAAVTLGTGLLFGLLPAVRISRADLYAGVRSAAVGDAVGRRVRGALVVGQVAVALVLLVGAGLLMRSFQRLNTVELGFDPEGVLAVRLALPAQRFTEPAARIGYYNDLLESMESIPGVVSVGATTSIPLAGTDHDADFRIEHEPPPDPTQANVAWIRQVTRGYFRTIGLRLLEGRPFDAGDAAGAPRVVIVNASLARRYFDYPRRNPIGTRVTFGDPDAPDATWRTIVGIARDTRHFGIRDGTRPAMYFPYEQVPSTAMTLVLRTEGDPAGLSADVRSAVTSVDPTLAASSIAPLGSWVEGALETDRFVTSLLGLFAALALVLAAVGLYGVVSYGVTRRMREMGIRLALGAGGVDVRRLVVNGGLRLTLLGIALGLAGSLFLTRVLEALLYDVSVTDPVTFVAMAGVLAAIALLASWLPARRASRADPVAVLREE